MSTYTMNKNTKVITFTVLFVLILLALGIYFTIVNYQVVFHHENVVGHLVDPIKQNCVTHGGKYVAGWVGGHPAFFCIPE